MATQITEEPSDSPPHLNFSN